MSRRHLRRMHPAAPAGGRGIAYVTWWPAACRCNGPIPFAGPAGAVAPYAPPSPYVGASRPRFCRQFPALPMSKDSSSSSNSRWRIVVGRFTAVSTQRRRAGRRRSMRSNNSNRLFHRHRKRRLVDSLLRHRKRARACLWIARRCPCRRKSQDVLAGRLELCR
ncbi:hypothetical protein BCR44DRAFT_1329703 [Catenaria anguillulae PL171]|uniref:Uncharacterized protein n=1 Tax=Catenaria anguillulae PL171 TaxID=765915 RepID=A0A1Y2H6H3_9FUNG|nr:hypothetical protein BCR44DRAFT_1329703 [Catenaria anguillulae PL171]